MARYWALRVAFLIARYVPLRWLYAVGMLGGEAAYWLWPSKRHNTRRNMAVVCGAAGAPNGDPDGRGAGITAMGTTAGAGEGLRSPPPALPGKDGLPEALARASWRHYGAYIMDVLRLPHTSQAEIVRRTRVQGWEHLDSAMAAGKGVIFVTGHFGIWDYAPTTVADRYPGRVHVVAETFASPHVDRLIQGQRAALGVTVVPMTNVRQMLRVLRNKDILALLVDRPAHGDGVPVRFFGHETTVPAGAATLAALTGAAVIPGYLFHRPDGDYDGGILPAIAPLPAGDRAARVRHMTQGIFSALESIIAPRPHNWYMFRDLWARPVTAQGPQGVPATETAETAGTEVGAPA